MAQTPSNCVAQPLSINGASGSQPGNPPSNVLDNNLNTIWSNIGVGSWIMVDVGSIKTICSVDIAWYRGDLRQYNFNIRVWDLAAQQWKMVFNGKSSGATAGFERYNVPDTSGQYVVIFVNGNTENSFASISEIDVNGITGSIICGNQPLILNAASGGEAANPPSNAVDNSLSTRWSNNAIGSWIIVDLGSIKTICNVDIAWYRGDLRQYNFDIRVWDSAAQQWKMVFNGKSSGATAGFERYNVPDTSGRYVVIFVNGNTENSFASISEIDVNGLTSLIPTIRDSSLQVQVVAAGLSLPTSMAFIGPNDILVLEKNTGMVKRVKDGAVLSPPLLDVNVATDSERGMLGIDVVRIAPTQHYVFLYYTEANSFDGGTPIGNRLVRYIFTHDPNSGPAQGTITFPVPLLNLPVTPGPNHNGGKVMVGPDSNVYTVLGDLNRQTQAQNFENGPPADGTGGILRVTQNGGTVGSGIIGSSSPLDKYFAYGIRNSFGIDFDPLTGNLWDTENGPSSNDELNLVAPGFNSGWRDLMGMAPAGFDFNNLVNFGGQGKYSDPEFVWSQVVAPTAIEFLTSAVLGSQYQNDMFVADFNNGRIYDFNLTPQRDSLVLSGVLSDRVANTHSETQSVIFGQGFPRITDLKVGIGDGYLYVLTIGDGKIYRIVPKATTTSLASETEPPWQGETDNSKTFGTSNEVLNIDTPGFGEVEKNMDNNKFACEKMEDRIDDIDQQDKRDWLTEEEADELKNRIESIMNNLGCE